MAESGALMQPTAFEVEIGAVHSTVEDHLETAGWLEARDAEPDPGPDDTPDGDPAIVENDRDPAVVENEGDPTVAEDDGDSGGDAEIAASADEGEGGEQLGATERLDSIVESLLLAAGAPLPVRRIVDVVGGPKSKEVREAVARLIERYSGPDCGIHLVEVASGYQFRTSPANAKFVRTLLRQKPARLGRAALETLSIVAYKQPVTRGEVEAIRGVDADSAINTLLANKLIRIDGRRETVGRPLLYATTPEFLEVFGLKDLRELPTLKEIGPVPEPDYEADIEEDDNDTIDVEEAVAAAAAQLEERAIASRAGGEAGAAEVEGGSVSSTSRGELAAAAEGEDRAGSTRGGGMVAAQIEEQAVESSPGVAVADTADEGLAVADTADEGLAVADTADEGLAPGPRGNGVAPVAARPGEDDEPDDDEADDFEDDEDDDLDEDDLDEDSDDDFDFDDEDEDEDDEEEAD
jgi:segregation and condensation protein B